MLYRNLLFCLWISPQIFSPLAFSIKEKTALYSAILTGYKKNPESCLSGIKTCQAHKKLAFRA